MNGTTRTIPMEQGDPQVCEPTDGACNSDCMGWTIRGNLSNLLSYRWFHRCALPNRHGNDHQCSCGHVWSDRFGPVSLFTSLDDLPITAEDGEV